MTPPHFLIQTAVGGPVLMKGVAALNYVPTTGFSNHLISPPVFFLWPLGTRKVTAQVPVCPQVPSTHFE